MKKKLLIIIINQIVYTITMYISNLCIKFDRNNF